MSKNSKIKVLHCIGALKAGGAEKQLRLLLKHIDTSSYQMNVLTLNDWLGCDTLPTNVTVIKVERGRKWNIISLWIRIIREIYTCKPDILHIWLPEIVTIPAAFAGTLLQIPILSTHRHSPGRNISTSQWLRDKAGYLPHLLSKQLVTNFDVKSLKKSLFKFIFVWKNGEFITNAIEEEKINNLPTNHDFYKHGYFNLIYAGRLVEQKNPELIIYATQELVKQGYKIHSHIFGKGSKEAHLKSLVKTLQLSDHIYFHGFRDNWLEFAKTADVFVLPSRVEGTPNVLLEASVIGLPIIATKIPEITYIFTHKKDALLVEVNSCEAIVKAIKILYESEDVRNHLIKEALNISNNFSVKKMISPYEELYVNILK